MNKTRRGQLDKLYNAIDNLKSQLENLREDLDTIKTEEEEYFENIPDSLKEGERAQTSETAIENMQEAYDQFDEVIDGLSEVLDFIDSAKE